MFMHVQLVYNALLCGVGYPVLCSSFRLHQMLSEAFPKTVIVETCPLSGLLLPAPVSQMASCIITTGTLNNNNYFYTLT